MKTTPLIITIVVITLGIYDLAVVLISGTASSVSQVMTNAGYDSPYLVFASGWILGHWWGGMKPKKNGE